MTFLGSIGALALLSIIAALVHLGHHLGRIATMLEDGALRGPQGERGPQGIQGEPGPVPTPMEPAREQPHQRTDLVEVLKQQGMHWAHHAWVQLNSDAYVNAMRAKEYAVIRHGELMDKGTQE